MCADMHVRTLQFTAVQVYAMEPTLPFTIVGG